MNKRLTNAMFKLLMAWCSACEPVLCEPAFNQYKIKLFVLDKPIFRISHSAPNKSKLLMEFDEICWYSLPQKYL